MDRPTAVLAEDEPILLAQLKAKLEKLWPELEILATAEDGEAALEAIDEHQPDFVFLDIQMPEKTGVEVARQLGGKSHVVFVTAYDQYAVQAFEAGAVDYVLKPVTEERLATTVERLKQKLATPPPNLDAIIGQLAVKLRGGEGGQKLKWIKATMGQNLRLIPVAEVLFFQSDEKYTRVVTAESEALIKTPIRELIDGTDPEDFWQIHRSTLVNVKAIAGVTRDFRGQAHVKIKGKDETLVVSRVYSHLFKQM
jgi:DNA-binding LytR/AlgR family response regulator